MKIRIVLLTGMIMTLVLLIFDVGVYIALASRLTAVTRLNLATNVAAVSQMAPSHVNNGSIAVDKGDLDWLLPYVRQGETVFFARPDGHIIRTVGEANVPLTSLPTNSLQGGVKSTTTFNNGKAALYAVASIYSEDNGKLLGYVALLAPTPRQSQFMHILLVALVIGSVGAVGLVTLAAYVIAMSVVRPLHSMLRAVGGIEAHNIDKRVPVGSGNDEVVQLSVAFNRMLDRIERSIQQQTRFITDASHEIRTPLTIIKGYANMLARWGKNDAERLEEGVMVIRREADRLHKMANDLLTLSSAETSLQDEPHDADAELAIRELVGELHTIYPDKDIHLNLQTIPPVKMAPTHFKRVLLNVLDNALKYTQSGRPVVVSTSHSDGEVTVEVEDSGPGISHDALVHVFERFYRAENTRASGASGSGLGLAIVKELLELYGGEVGIETDGENGTLVSLVIPSAERS